MTRSAIASTFLLFCAAMTAAPCLAQTSAQFQSCNKTAKTQLDLDKCASLELMLRDKQMQSVYSAILSRIAGQPTTVKKVKAMQSAWLAYMVAYLDALYPASNKQAEYGSIYPMQFALARAAFVQRHTLELQELLANVKRYK